MPKKYDPIYTALGQVQRAQRRAAKKLSLAPLTEKRIDKALRKFEPEEGGKR